MLLNKTVLSFLMILFFVIGDMKSQKLTKKIGYGDTANYDYNTISDAAADLDSLVSHGSVEFEISPGTYKEQFEIKHLESLNDGDSVLFTIYGDTGEVIIENESEFSEKYLVKLNGCQRVTFNNITFRTTSTDLYNQIILTGGASYNRFENCVFEANEDYICDSQNYKNGIVIYDEPSADKNEFNKFLNNKIIGGCLGISLEGKTGELEEGNKIIENEFTKQTIKSVQVLHNSKGFFNKNIVLYEGGGNAITLNVDKEYEVQGNTIYSNGSTALFIDTFNAQQPKIYDASLFLLGTFVGLSVFNNKISCPKGIALKGNQIEGFFLGHNTLFNESKEKYTMNIDSVKYMLSVFNLLVNRATHGVFKITSNAAVKSLPIDKELGSDFNGIYSGGDTIGSFNDNIYESIENWRTNRHGPDANSSFGSIEFDNDTLGLELICGTSPSMRIKEVSEFIDTLIEFNLFKTKDINGKSRESSNFWKGQADITVKINVNGYITDSLGSDTLKNAVVKIFTKRANKEKLQEIDEFNVSNGSYALDSLPYRDNYWLKIIPDKELYPNYIPSYHTKELRWDTGDKGPRPLSDFCNDEVIYNIFPRKLKEILVGDYNISGNISETVSQTGVLTKVEGTDPIPGLDVILDKLPPSVDNTVAITQTDDDGNYSFLNLPEGDYQISIDYEGLPADTLYQVALNENNDSIINLDYCVDTTSQIEGCSNQSLGNKNIEFSNLKVFPNPMGEILKISGVEGSFNVRVVDTRGRNILQVLNQNKNTLISTTNFESGVYFVSIKTQNGEYVYKVLK